MNAGYVLISIFAMLTAVVFFTMLFVAEWYSWFALGFCIAFVVIEVIETFKERRYLSVFRNKKD